MTGMQDFNLTLRASLRTFMNSIINQNFLKNRWMKHRRLFDKCLINDQDLNYVELLSEVKYFKL